MKRTALLVAAILVLALAGSAQADRYVGVYGGYTYVPDTDFDVGLNTIPDVGMDAGPTVGGKVGMWASTLPWVAIEFNVWNTWTGIEEGEGPDINLNLLNFSGSVLLQYLAGPWRAYAGGGVVGTWAELSNSGSEDDFAIGGMGQAGIEYEIVPHWTVFGEYRYIWNSFEFDDIDWKFDLGRHQGVGGINFRF